MSQDVQAALLARIANIERQLVNKVRLGRVAKGGVKKDQVRVEMGGTSGGKPLLSPWVRTGHHHGWMNENVSFEEGQTVMMIAMDGDFRQAVVLPYSSAEHDPLPEDAKEKKHTRRIRKPREAKQDQGGEDAAAAGGAEAGGGGDMFSGGQDKDYKPEEYDKQKDDDENDWIERNDYDGHYRRKKKAKQLFGLPEQDEQQGGQQQADPAGDKKKERVWHEVGNASILVVDGQIKFKVGGSVYTMTDGQIVQTTGQQTFTWKPGELAVTGGGKITHDQQGIGKGHKHKDVEPGGGTTGDPVPQ